MEKFSIVIPAHNAQKTIARCLEAVFAAEGCGHEVIVVNDASTDRTDELARQFPCKIIYSEQKKGPAHSRIVGLKAASCDTVVFIDSDIVIARDTFGKLTKAFSVHSDAVAIVGILSKAHPNSNFFSQYKNIYMHYIFNCCPNEIDFVYGSFYAIKRDYGDFIPVSSMYGEDTELGLHLEQQGCKIVLEKSLEVVHLKEYSFLSFIKNDFLIPFYWARLFLRQKGWRRLAQKKRFCHASGRQLIGVVLVPLSIAGIFFLPFCAIGCAVLFFILNIKFFLFLFRERGFLFAIKSVFTAYLDAGVMACGVVSGFFASFRKGPRKVEQ